jgi:hypothetical protein
MRLHTCYSQTSENVLVEDINEDIEYLFDNNNNNFTSTTTTTTSSLPSSISLEDCNLNNINNKKNVLCTSSSIGSSSNR